MSGDSNCLAYYQNADLLKQNRIIYFNRNGDITGYRTAMSPQEIQMCQHQQYMNQMANINLQYQINSFALQNQIQNLNNNLMLYRFMR